MENRNVIEDKLRAINSKVAEDDLCRSIGKSLHSLMNDLTFLASQDEELKELLDQDKLHIECGSAYHMPTLELK